MRTQHLLTIERRHKCTIRCNIIDVIVKLELVRSLELSTHSNSERVVSAHVGRSEAHTRTPHLLTTATRAPCSGQTMDQL